MRQEKESTEGVRRLNKQRAERQKPVFVNVEKPTEKYSARLYQVPIANMNQAHRLKKIRGGDFYGYGSEVKVIQLEGISCVYAFHLRASSSEQKSWLFCCLLSLNGRFITPFNSFFSVAYFRIIIQEVSWKYV